MMKRSPSRRSSGSVSSLVAAGPVAAGNTDPRVGDDDHGGVCVLLGLDDGGLTAAEAEQLKLVLETELTPGNCIETAQKSVVRLAKADTEAWEEKVAALEQIAIVCRFLFPPGERAKRDINGDGNEEVLHPDDCQCDEEEFHAPMIEQRALFVSDVLFSLRIPLAGAIGDLRSSLVRRACACTSILAACLGPQRFESSVPFVLPALIKQCGASLKIIGEEATQCLCVVIHRDACPSARALKYVLQEALESHSAVLRERASGAIHVAVQSWDLQALMRVAVRKPLRQTMMRLLQDASGPVRAKARTVFEALQEKLPIEAEALLDDLPPESSRNLRRMLSTTSTATSGHSQARSTTRPKRAIGHRRTGSQGSQSKLSDTMPANSGGAHARGSRSPALKRASTAASNSLSATTGGVARPARLQRTQTAGDPGGVRTGRTGTPVGRTPTSTRATRPHTTSSARTSAHSTSSPNLLREARPQRERSLSPNKRAELHGRPKAATRRERSLSPTKRAESQQRPKRQASTGSLRAAARASSTASGRESAKQRPLSVTPQASARAGPKKRPQTEQISRVKFDEIESPEPKDLGDDDGLAFVRRKIPQTEEPARTVTMQDAVAGLIDVHSPEVVSTLRLTDDDPGDELTGTLFVPSQLFSFGDDDLSVGNISGDKAPTPVLEEFSIPSWNKVSLSTAEPVVSTAVTQASPLRDQLLEEAQAALSLADISELKVMSRPPATVGLLLEAVWTLLNGKTHGFSNNEGRAMLARPGLLRDLKEFRAEPGRLHHSVISKLHRLGDAGSEVSIDDDALDPQNVQKICQAATSLSVWVRATRDFYQAQRDDTKHSSSAQEQPRISIDDDGEAGIGAVTRPTNGNSPALNGGQVSATAKTSQSLGTPVLRTMRANSEGSLPSPTADVSPSRGVFEEESRSEHDRTGSPEILDGSSEILDALAEVKNVAASGPPKVPGFAGIAAQKDATPRTLRVLDDVQRPDDVVPLNYDDGEDVASPVPDSLPRRSPGRSSPGTTAPASFNGGPRRSTPVSRTSGRLSVNTTPSPGSTLGGTNKTTSPRDVVAARFSPSSFNPSSPVTPSNLRTTGW